MWCINTLKQDEFMNQDQGPPKDFGQLQQEMSLGTGLGDEATTWVHSRDKAGDRPGNSCTYSTGQTPKTELSPELKLYSLNRGERTSMSGWSAQLSPIGAVRGPDRQ